MARRYYQKETADVKAGKWAIKHWVAIFLVGGLGLWYFNMLPSLPGSVAGTTPPIFDATATIDNINFESGLIVNGTANANTYIEVLLKDSIDFKVTDVMAADDQYAYVNLTAYRTTKGAHEAACFPVVFTSSDFSDSTATTRNLVSLDSSGNIEVLFDGVAGTQYSNNGRTSKSDYCFAAGSLSKLVQLSIKMDENGHDALTTYQTRALGLTVGGKSAGLSITNNE